jgi:KaiC/GvpD/RAD55 family RecA-like ATPase
MGGGISKGAILLLLAPPGSGKTILSERFAIDGLKKKENVLYIATGMRYSQLIKTLRTGGVKNEKNLFFIDCFSWRSPGKNPEETGNVTIIESITDLNELARKISDTIKTMGSVDRLVLDSISDLLLYSDPNAVFKFLQYLKTEVVKAKATALFALEFGLHDEKTNTTVNYVSDAMIELRTVGDRQLRIARIKGETHPLDWVPYAITRDISIRLNPPNPSFNGEKK